MTEIQVSERNLDFLFTMEKALIPEKQIYFPGMASFFHFELLSLRFILSLSGIVICGFQELD